jgi:hypothetical protein
MVCEHGRPVMVAPGRCLALPETMAGVVVALQLIGDEICQRGRLL